MQEKPFSHQDLIDGILTGDPKIFKYIQKSSTPFLTKLTGKPESSAEVKELFQDTMVVLFRKITQTGLEINCQFMTYFLGVCKKIWFYEKNGMAMNPPHLGGMDYPVEMDEEEIAGLYEESKEFQLYKIYFKKLNKKQQQILQASLNGTPYHDLFHKFGYSNADVLKNEVCRIRKKLISQITSDPMFIKLKNRKNWSV